MTYFRFLFRQKTNELKRFLIIECWHGLISLFNIIFNHFSLVNHPVVLTKSVFSKNDYFSFSEQIVFFTLRCTMDGWRKTICINCRICLIKHPHFEWTICHSLPLFWPSIIPPSTLSYMPNCIILKSTKIESDWGSGRTQRLSTKDSKEVTFLISK